MQVDMKINVIKCIRPYNLDLKSLLKIDPPSFRYKHDGFLYLVDLWFNQYRWRKESQVLVKDEFVPLHSQNMKSVLYDYQKYLNYLVKVGVFRVNNSYQTGVKSKSYRLNPEYQKEILVDYISDIKLIKKIESKERYHRTIIDGKYDYITKWFDGLEIDKEAAFAYIEQYVSSNYKPKMKASRKNRLNLKKACYTQSINKIYDQDFQFKLDEKGGRMYTVLTNLKKEFRKYLTYRGEKLVCIDLSNSQPFLSQVLLDKTFYKKNTKGIITLFELKKYVQTHLSQHINEVNKHLHHYNRQVTTTGMNNKKSYSSQSSSLPMCGKNSYTDDFLDEWSLYSNLLKEGKFYDYIGEHISNTAKDNNLVKSSKKLVLTVLFSSNNDERSYFIANKKVFRNLFPSVSRLFEIIKSIDHTLLAVLLQNIESEIFLNRISKIIADDESIPFFTIHDSICTTLQNEAKVKAIISNEIESSIGVKPHLKVEYWC